MIKARFAFAVTLAMAVALWMSGAEVGSASGGDDPPGRQGGAGGAPGGEPGGQPGGEPSDPGEDAGEDAEDPTPAPAGDETNEILVIGTVKEVGEGTFEVQAVGGQKGKWKISTTSRTAYQTLQMVKLSDVEKDTMVHVLGRAVNLGTRKAPKSGYTHVHTILAASEIPRQPVPEDLKKQDLRWYTGSLDRQSDGCYVAGGRVVCEPSFEVFSRRKGLGNEVKKGSPCLIRGARTDSDKLELQAKDILVLDEKSYRSANRKLVLPL